MIIIKFSGGLGNQLYQLAFALSIAHRYPDEIVKADISNYVLYDAHNGYEIDRVLQHVGANVFPIASIREQFWHCGEIPLFYKGRYEKEIEKVIAWLNARTRKIFELCNVRHCIKEINEEGDWADIQSIVNQLQCIRKGENWYLDGYWARDQYYADSIEKVVAELQFIPIDSSDSKNIEWKKMIESTNSVSIHVRRGDYVGSCFDVITLDYYRIAVKKIKDLIDNPVFFIFTDDFDYVKDNFQWLQDPWHVIDNNMGEQSFRDMQLMSLCKNNIIANSSFSTWAAILNHNAEKYVIGPKMYTSSAETPFWGLQWIMI